MRRNRHMPIGLVDAVQGFLGQPRSLTDGLLSRHWMRNISSLRRIGSAAAAVSATLLLSGCVESERPLLSDAKPLLGQQFEVHLYEDFVNKKASDFHTSVYHWKDGQYERASNLARDVTRFAAQSFTAEDFLIQAARDTEKKTSGEHEKLFDYWIGRRLVDGVYLIFALDEADVDDATRGAMCGKEKPPGICHIRSYGQLAILARATAAKPVRKAALGVILAK